VGQGLAMVLER